MTMVPFWSPMLMPMRYFLGGATLGEVALSLGILARVDGAGRACGREDLPRRAS